MNSRPEKRTLKLKVDKDIRFRLIGISSHENDYRLVWAINNQMKMNFIKADNLVIHSQKRSDDLEFSRYTFTDEDRYITYHLISNRCPDGFLFPKIRKLDFVLRVTGDTSQKDIDHLIKAFRNIGIISAVYQLEPSSLRNINQINVD